MWDILYICVHTFIFYNNVCTFRCSVRYNISTYIEQEMRRKKLCSELCLIYILFVVIVHDLRRLFWPYYRARKRNETYGLNLNWCKKILRVIGVVWQSSGLKMREKRLFFISLFYFVVMKCSFVSCEIFFYPNKMTKDEKALLH